MGNRLTRVTKMALSFESNLLGWLHDNVEERNDEVTFLLQASLILPGHIIRKVPAKEK